MLLTALLRYALLKLAVVLLQLLELLAWCRQQRQGQPLQLAMSSKEAKCQQVAQNPAAAAALGYRGTSDSTPRKRMYVGPHFDQNSKLCSQPLNRCQPERNPSRAPPKRRLQEAVAKCVQSLHPAAVRALVQFDVTAATTNNTGADVLSHVCRLSAVAPPQPHTHFTPRSRTTLSMDRRRLRFAAKLGTSSTQLTAAAGVPSLVTTLPLTACFDACNVESLHSNGQGCARSAKWEQVVLTSAMAPQTHTSVNHNAEQTST